MMMMVQRLAVLMSLFAVFCVESNASLIPGAIPGLSSDSEPIVRVRLQQAVALVAIRGYDLQIFQTLNRLPALADAPEQSSAWDFRCEDHRVRAISARGNKVLDLASPVSISTPAGLVNLNSRPYRGKVRIYAVGSLCEVVNELGIEKYLAGLVNSEFNSKWNGPATEAQVIAARTHALYQIQSSQLRRGSHYDVDSTIRDQVYDGFVHEDYRGAVAVQNTRGMALLAQGPRGHWLPIKAFYHSTCAGRTELPQNVWGNKFVGFNHSVTCQYCRHSPSISWKLALSDSDVRSLMLRGAESSGAPRAWPRNWRSLLTKGQLIDMQPGPWTPSLRRAELTSFWKNDLGRVEQLKVSATQFRDWVGTTRLRSTVFNVQQLGGPGKTSTWAFNGRGSGHGVGMCQWGAKVMGDRGFSAVAILQHYYPDGVLRKLW